MMIVTEEQARNKECDQWINEITPQYFTNGGDNVEAIKPSCSGSRCMAWRWDKKSKTKIDHTEMEYTKRIDVTKKEWLGYCGKAGKPEV